MDHVLDSLRYAFAITNRNAHAVVSNVIESPPLPARYRWLTRSYVDWLGLEIIPIARRRNQGFTSMGDGGCLPTPGESAYVEGVSFEGRLYERQADGLAYARLGA